MAMAAGAQDPGDGRRPPKKDDIRSASSSSKTFDDLDDMYTEILNLALQYRNETGITPNLDSSVDQFHQYVTKHGSANITRSKLRAVINTQQMFNKAVHSHKAKFSNPSILQRFQLARELWGFPPSPRPPLPPGPPPTPPPGRHHRRRPPSPPRLIPFPHLSPNRPPLDPLPPLPLPSLRAPPPFPCRRRSRRQHQEIQEIDHQLQPGIMVRQEIVQDDVSRMIQRGSRGNTDFDNDDEN